MAVSPLSLIHTPGELRREWWEGEDLEALIVAWLSDGASWVPSGAAEDKADAVVRAHAYVRAYEDKAASVAAKIGSKALPSGLSTSTPDGGVKFWERKAEAKEKERDLAIARAVPVADPPAGTGGSAPPLFSRSIPIERGW